MFKSLLSKFVTTTKVILITFILSLLIDFFLGNKILEITDNVILNDLINEYKILSDKIIYNQLDEVFKSFNKTEIDYQNKYLIETDNILYDKSKNIIFLIFFFRFIMI